MRAPAHPHRVLSGRHVPVSHVGLENFWELEDPDNDPHRVFLFLLVVFQTPQSAVIIRLQRSICSLDNVQSSTRPPIIKIERDIAALT